MLALVLALFLDRLSIAWPSALHPVAWFGSLAESMKRRLYESTHGPTRQGLYGLLLAVLAPAAALLAVQATIWLAGTLRLGFVTETLLLASTFTLSGLVRAAHRVETALRQEDVESARESLQSLCSRDPSDLEAEELTAATIESVAENTSDSWVAPLFWYALLGLPGAVVYRAVNTLDAMYGYRGPFEYFGKASARLDDVLNLIPARITALLFWVGSWDTPIDARSSLRIWWRDRKKTSSPNAGQAMAMMAAVLGIRLSKRGEYTLGEPLRPLVADRIPEACEVSRRAAGLMVVLTLSLWNLL